MYQLFQFLNETTSESIEEQHDRLTESAAEAGCDPETLFEIEQDIKDLSAVARAEIDADPEAEAAEAVNEIAATFGLPIDGEGAVEAAGGTETVVALLAQTLTARPQTSAILAKFAYDTYRRHGFYEEAGIDPEPNWARLDDPIPVVGQHVRSVEPHEDDV